MSLRGLTVTVARNATGDYTNRGVSALHDHLTVVGYLGDTEAGDTDGVVIPLPADSQRCVPTKDTPAVAIEIRRIGNPIPSIIPVVWDDQRQGYKRVHPWTQSGGNFANLMDSRLNNLLERLIGSHFYGAVAIHDRVEN